MKIETDFAKIGKRLTKALLSLLLAVLVWEIIGYVLESPLLPSVSGVVQRLIVVLSDTEVYEHLTASILLVGSGFLLSVVVALPTSLVCYKLPIARDLLLPMHEFIRYIPVPAFVPLCAALFGVGSTTKIVLIFVGTYFQLIFMFIANLNAVRPEIEESARTLGLRGGRLVRLVTLRASSAELLTSIRISFAWAWSYLLVAEVVNAHRGIGFLVLQSYRALNMERLMALLVVIGVFGLLADAAFRSLRRAMCPWAYCGITEEYTGN